MWLFRVADAAAVADDDSSGIAESVFVASRRVMPVVGGCTRPFYPSQRFANRAHRAGAAREGWLDADWWLELCR